MTAKWIASFFGVGFTPQAPGTAGSFAALFLIYFLDPVAPMQKLTCWVFILIVGCWAARAYMLDTKKKDPPEIVIDEVIGMGIATWTAGPHWVSLLLAFGLFRLFDIAKIPPVRGLDNWSKNTPPKQWYSGLTVILDDVLAGVQALIIIMALQLLEVLPLP